MSKLKILISFLFFLLILFVFYLFVNPVIFGVESKKFSVLPNQTNLRNYVKYLTNFNKPRSHKNPKILDDIAFYIYDNFESSNCDKVILQTYAVDSVEYKNIICRFNGKDPEKIIIGAHYDVYVNYINTGDTEKLVFPGADSNASGVAGVLELARLIGKNKGNLKNSIEFVAYTLAEEPYFATKNMGSYIHAKSLYEKKEKVKYMLSLDSIGYFSDEEIQKYPFSFLKFIYPKKGNFIAIIGSLFDFNMRNLKKSIMVNCSVPIRSINTPIFVDGVDLSDHRSYWLFGYKAYMITDTAAFRNMNYHTKLDTLETLDFNKMTEVIKGLYGVIIN